MERFSNLQNDKQETKSFVASREWVKENYFNKFWKRIDESKVEKCCELLMQVEKVDSTLLNNLPKYTKKYQITFQRIEEQANLLKAYKLLLPNLPVLLETCNQHLISFNKEKKYNRYKDYSEAAVKLECNILLSISKLEEVMNELEMDLDLSKEVEFFKTVAAVILADSPTVINTN